MDTESTDISNDGPRQPHTEVDDAETPRAEPAPQAPEADQNGAGASPSSATGSSTPEPPALGDSSDEAEAAATTPEPATMSTTQTGGSSPTDNDDAGDSPNGTDPAAPTEAGGTTENAADTATDAGAPPDTPAPAASHDPVTDAVTTELPAVPATVQGLDDAPAGPSAPTDSVAGSTSDTEADDGSSGADTDGSASTAAPSASEPSSPEPSSPEPPDPGAPTGDEPYGPAAPRVDLAVTTEMPKIDAPAPSTAPAGSSGDGNRAVYEVRAAAVKADTPAATDSSTVADPATTEPSEPEPPVTEPIPTVVERPSSVRDDAPTVTERPSPAPARDESTRVLGTDERPRHFRVGPAKPINTGEVPQVEDEPKRRRLKGATVAVLAPLVVVMLLIVAWAADTASLSGQVLRNVEIAGRQIGGKGEEALPEIMADVAAEQAERKVTIEVEGDPDATTTPTTAALQQLEGRRSESAQVTSYETTTAALGLVLDEDATTQAALDMGRGDTVFVRPLKWLKSFFSAREVPLQFTVTETQTAATLQLLQGADRTAPTDPSIQLTDGGFVMTPGRAGQGIDVSKVASDLREAARSTDGPITITASAEPERPQFSDDEAQQLADRANGLTADGITLKADTAAVPVSAQQLRSWIKPTVVDGKLDLTFDSEKATSELPALFASLDAEPKNASMTLEGGVPKVVPAANGVTCCGDDAADRIWDGVQQEKAEVELEAVVKEPEITTEEVQGWGIKEAVGGNRGYQSGTELNGGGLAAGFTTFHDCCAPRVTNIHKIADIVRGTVIPPDGTFSVNETVGQRTRAKGFVEAGAIAEGQHVQEVGGGVSQFATTTFNAAYFAGLDIEESQSHSEWFPRYPPGREATMGYPQPDLVIHNNTPYGVMIWTSYTETSLTVTMYSTHYAEAEQSGISETMSGACRVVTTTRTRTYPDKPSETDTFRSTYRPGEGKTC